VAVAVWTGRNVITVRMDLVIMIAEKILAVVFTLKIMSYVIFVEVKAVGIVA